MRRAAAVAALVAVLGTGVLSGVARAEEDLPRGRIGLILGMRQGVGALGNAFTYGPIGGVEAGYVFDIPGMTRWSVGSVWSVLWGRFWPDDATVTAGNLDVREINLGLHVRRTMGPDVPRFLAFSLGVSLLRSNVPIPPDSSRDYVGPYASIGVEQYVAGTYLIGVQIRYGIFATGPGSLSILSSFSFGSR